MVNDHKAVQRQTAQYDLFNRLHSIAGDEPFVRGIAEHYGGRYEVIGMSPFPPLSFGVRYDTDGLMGSESEVWDLVLRPKRKLAT
jgi:hypothetical protein